MAEKIPCNIKVGLKEFNLMVGREEEEYVRRAAKLINERMDFVREKVGLSESYELLAFVALDYAIDNLKFDSKHSDLQKTVMTKISEMDSLVDSILK
ncbi:cell division protein ZapA [Flectobacillus major]|jgi:cell division protein ZapA|uniref:cell division protein ZapA n=1 Tax=Flectobacillus major TaxID=103 RepID=UPI0005C4796D|nr:cell division protein ZapA [Flectobacillus major]